MLFTKCSQLLPVRLHQMRSLALANVKVNFSHTLASPCTAEELATAEKVGFSSVRHRELSNNVSIAHTSSVFGSGFMNIQLSSSYVDEGNRTTHSEMLAQLENYECLASINLNAVTQTNVPEPFSSSSENQQLDSHLDMPGLRQRVKFTASDLQGTMYPDNSTGLSHMLKNNRVHGLSQTFSAWYSNKQLTSQPTQLAYCHYSTESKQEVADGQDKPTNPPSWKSKFKLVVAQYGPIAIVFHVTISLASLGVCYLAVVSGLDIPSLLAKFQTTFLSTDKLTSSLATGATTWTVAYAIHKVFAPVRIAMTVFCVPYIARYLRRIGLLKKPS